MRVQNRDCLPDITHQGNNEFLSQSESHSIIASAPMQVHGLLVVLAIAAISVQLYQRTLVRYQPTVEAASRNVVPGAPTRSGHAATTTNTTLAELLVAGSLDAVDTGGVGSVAQVLQAAEESSGGSADFKARRQYLARSGLKDGDLALEVSPLHSPLLRQGPTTFNLDMRTRDELVSYWKLSAEEADRIPHVHFKWAGEPYAAIVGDMRFKRIVASHVIEHVPCLLTWLESLHDVLARGGQVRLFVPDMRFTPDYLRPPTFMHEILGARFERRTRPTYETIFDHRYYHRVADKRNKAPHENWARPPQAPPPGVEQYDIDLLQVGVDQAKAEFDGTVYEDAHVWKWTPTAFAAHMDALHRVGLLKLRLETLVPTCPAPSPGLHATEFFAVLVKD